MILMIIDAILVCYTVFIMLIIIKTTIKQKRPPNKHLKDENFPDLSIVIPFRNEENHLLPLISSLSDQVYPGAVEIVLIDDQSDDNSENVIQKCIPSCRHEITLLKTNFNDSVNLTSKQQAINTGITASKHDAIVFTDADMLFEPDWLYSMGEQLSNGADLVFGRSSIYTDNKNMFTLFQAFQLDFLFSVAYCFFHSGITGSCMGNNMAISRIKYFDIGGYSSTGYSIVEDRALFAQFKRHHLICRITTPFYSKAYTYPCTTFSQFYHQMQRWARGGLSAKSILMPLGILFAFQNVIFCLSIPGLLAPTSTIIAAFNFLLTWVLTAVSFRYVKSGCNSIFFPLFYCILIIESIIFAGSLLFSRSIQWKGRLITK